MIILCFFLLFLNFGTFFTIYSLNQQLAALKAEKQVITGEFNNLAHELAALKKESANVLETLNNLNLSENLSQTNYYSQVILGVLGVLAVGLVGATLVAYLTPSNTKVIADFFSNLNKTNEKMALDLIEKVDLIGDKTTLKVTTHLDKTIGDVSQVLVTHVSEVGIQVVDKILTKPEVIDLSTKAVTLPQIPLESIFPFIS